MGFDKVPLGYTLEDKEKLTIMYMTMDKFSNVSNYDSDVITRY